MNRMVMTGVVGSAAAVVLLFLAGCGGTALHESFNDYAEVYATTQNQQMLVNLARLSNRHPAFFLQMGTITSTFQFTSQIGGNVGTQHTFNTSQVPGVAVGNTILDAATYGANAVLGANEQPTFSYTPLSGNSFATAVLVPISANVFYTLYEQGLPVDQLLRSMVQAIDFFDPKTGVTVTMVNSPDKDDPENYRNFLRMAGLARQLQLTHRLRVATQSTLNPVPSPIFTDPKLEDTLKAGQAGYVLQETEPGSGKYKLAQASSVMAFSLEPGSTEFIEQLRKEKYFRIEGDNPIKSTAAPDAQGGQPTMSIRLRPFIGVLGALATEQAVFDELAKNPDLVAGVPPTERQPVLRITWPDGHAKLEPRLVDVDYRGRNYMIADVEGTTWNRDVFILLNYLNSQIALDPKNLPVQQLIQVH